MNVVRHKTCGLSLILFGLFVWDAGAAQAQQYTATLLDPVAGDNSGATGINNAGQVVGYIGTAVTQATLWNGTTTTDLGSLAGTNSSGATGINNAGQVVGVSQNSSFVHATLWNGTTATDLGTNGGIESNATGINDARQVAGYVQLAGSNNLQATLWNGTTATNLVTPSGYNSLATGINNAGQVVGYVGATTSSQDVQAVVWNGTTATNLTPLSRNTGPLGLNGTNGGFTSAAAAINNAGQVVGESQELVCCLGDPPSLTAPVNRATLWNGTTPIDLGTLVGGFSSSASAINNAGQVVGESQIAGGGTLATDYHATLWEGGTVIDLNSVLTGSLPANVVLTNATGINDNGWIVADGLNSVTDTTEAFLLTPTVPLPGAAWLFVSGLSGFAGLAHRRRCAAWQPSKHSHAAESHLASHFQRTAAALWAISERCFFVSASALAFPPFGQPCGQV